MRRTRGTGCITLMNKGRYKYRGLLIVGINKNGNPKNKVFYGNTKKEVEEKINAYLNQDAPETKEIIVFNDALDLLYADAIKRKVKQKTLSIIETTSNILKNKWGYISLENMFSKEIEEQFLLWEKQYSYSQLQKLRNYGKKAFRIISEKYDLNIKNPFELTILAPHEPPRANYFTEKEIFLINREMNGVYKDIPLFLYETGLRINECLALKYGDIDNENNLIVINKTLSETKQKNGKYEIAITTPKTKLSYRMVPLTKVADDILLMRSQGFYNDEDLIFPSNNNTYLSARNVLRAFDKAIKSAKIEKNHRGLHSIRHSTVIRLFEELSTNGRSMEIDAIDISKIIGNKVDVAAYTYDIEQKNRAKKLKLILDKKEKSTYVDEPLIEKQNSFDFELEDAEYMSQRVLGCKQIAFEERDLYRKYAYRCYTYVKENQDLDWTAGEILCEDQKLWKNFKKTGKLDFQQLATMKHQLPKSEEWSIEKVRKTIEEFKKNHNKEEA